MVPWVIVVDGIRVLLLLINKYSENTNKFNNHYKIWKLCKYFDGIKNEKDVVILTK